MAADIPRFVGKTISLLNLERKAEIEETKALQEHLSPKELQKRGVCLLKLRIRGRRTGLYGRTLITFEVNKPGSDGKLPSHSLTPGDVVGLGYSNTDSKTAEMTSGIVSRVVPTAITVAFDETGDSLTFDDSGPFRLIKLANDITHRRLKSALEGLSKYREGCASHLIDVLFGNQPPGPPLQIKPFCTKEDSGFTLFNPLLDESQKQAVRFALCQREVAIIHGPPGTGKTTTVVEIILQAVKNLKMKVLACAPSNVAVDNMAEKLVKGKARVVRIGHPARLLTAVQEHSLDALLSNSDATSIVRDVRKDIDNALGRVRKSRNPSEKKHLRQEMKSLREELKQREQQAMRELLTKADVVLATNTSASSDGPVSVIREDHFDLVVIDEVAQSLEAGCWIPLLRAPRCILAGDHLQLPPTILSVDAAKKGLEVTLMERLIKLLGDNVVSMLTTQYRMNEKIMKWSSEALYNGQLTAHCSVQSHLLKDLPGIQETDETLLPLLLIDTTGCDVMEVELEDEVSKGNEGEADIVTTHVTSLISAGLQPSDIAVIAPYNLQVELLRMRLSARYPALEIKSVDGFQGREKEAVIISLVRSNKKGEVGFLAEHRRINVAITRARRHLTVVADSETVSHDGFLKSLMEYMSSEGEVRSAHEYLQEGPLFADSPSLQELQGVKALKGANKKKCREPRKNDGLQRHNSYDSNRQSNAEFSKTTPVMDSGTSQSADLSCQVSSAVSFETSNNQDNRPSPGDEAPSPLSTTPLMDSGTSQSADLSCQASSLGSFGTSNNQDNRSSPGDEVSSPLSTTPLMDSGTSQPFGVSCQVSSPCFSRVHNIQSYREGPSDEVLSSLSSAVPCGEAFVEQPSNAPGQHPKPRVPPRDSRYDRATLEKKITEFLKDPSKSELAFPKTLNSQQRFDVHSIAEELGLGHESKGEGQDRYIVVKKLIRKPKDWEEDNELVSTCPSCKKRLPTCNLQLHLLRCEQLMRLKQETNAVKSDSNVTYPKPPKLKTKSKPSSRKKGDEEDFDKLLASFSKMDSRCAFDSCKQSVRTLGQKCCCCEKIFCLGHHIPEVHGCGNAAKLRARQLAFKPSSGKPKTLDATRKVQLHRKLGKKLDEMSEQRKAKKKGRENEKQ